MKIRQIKTSCDIAPFGAQLLKKYKLQTYYDKYAPALFYGCYRKEDVESIKAHKGIALLLWGGSDAMRLSLLDSIRRLRRNRNSPIFHIAPSSFITDDLSRAGVPFYRFNVFPKDESLFKPAPIGRKVYMYASHTRGDRKDFYGISYIPVLQKALPDVEFIVQYSSPQSIPFEKMPEVYRECAVGIRLVPHDAGSCTVVELALMGRKCIWNGNFPSAIHYNNLDDVVHAIKTEIKREGETDTNLAVLSKKSIAGSEWLDTRTYTNQNIALT